MPRGLLFSFLLSCTAFATTSPSVQLGDLQLELPPGWKRIQSAQTKDARLIVLQKDADFVTLYQKEDEVELSDFVASAAKEIEKEKSESYGKHSWKQILISRPSTETLPEVFVAIFAAEFGGKSYLGFSRSETQTGAKANAAALLAAARFSKVVGSFSLTDSSFTGKKHYIGWGAAMRGDPQFMKNEVKYDVLHTQKVFASDAGGGYLATTRDGEETGVDDIRTIWKDLKTKIKPQDMYLQYSSGHGSSAGLYLPGKIEKKKEEKKKEEKKRDEEEDDEDDDDDFVTYSPNPKPKTTSLPWDEIRDTVLSLNAKETVIFTMSCHSGHLVESFNKVRSKWEGFPSHGKTLFVLASSTASTSSATGPGTDADEPKGPKGSAGSAFGHALWKALSGYADGYVDGVKDGYLTIAEIREYTRLRTQQVGKHAPVETGSYIPYTILSQVPDKKFLAQLEKEGGTGGMSDAQIERAIRDLNEVLAVHSE